MQDPETQGGSPIPSAGEGKINQIAHGEVVEPVSETKLKNPEEVLGVVDDNCFFCDSSSVSSCHYMARGGTTRCGKPFCSTHGSKPGCVAETSGIERKDSTSSNSSGSSILGFASKTSPSREYEHMVSTTAICTACQELAKREDMMKQTKLRRLQIGIGAGVLAFVILLVILIAGGDEKIPFCEVMEVPTPEEQERLIFRDLFGVDNIDDLNAAGVNDAEPMQGFAPDAKRIASMCLPIQQNVLGHIQTDKPVYKQNDMMFIEVFLINPISKKPYATENRWSNPYNRMEIKDQFGSTIYKSENSRSQVQAQSGSIVFTYKIPANLTGGEYTVESMDWSVPTVKRKFRINANSQPELFVTLDFDKKNYAPGQNGEAKLKVRKPDGTALPTGTKYQYQILNEHKSLYESSEIAFSTKNGEALIKFDLPKGSYKVVTVVVKTYLGFNSGRPVTSTFFAPIIERADIDVAFFPEMTGGDLVPYLPNKIYFQVMTKASNDSDRAVVEFHSASLFKREKSTDRLYEVANHMRHEHNGMSKFSVIPEDEFAYFLRVFRQFEDGMQQDDFPLPEVDSSLSVTATLFGQIQDPNAQNKTLRVKVATNKHYKDNGILTVALKSRSLELFKTRLNMTDGANHRTIGINYDHIYNNSLPNGGVLTLSVFEEEEKEVYVPPYYGGGIMPRPMKPMIEPVEEPLLDDEEAVAENNGDNDADEVKPEILPEVIEPEKPEEKPVEKPKPNATNNVKLERQVFIPPLVKQEFTVSTRKKTYSPGDLVEIDVNLTSALKDENEVFYASLTVTDLSSYLRIPKGKYPPSLAAMTYLEKEVMHLNKQVDDFPYANEYLDNMFQTMRSTNITEILRASANVDLLLGAQTWRKFLFDEDVSIWDKMNNAKTDDEKLSYKYVQVGTQNNYYYDRPVFFGAGVPEMAMADGVAMDDMAMPMMAANNARGEGEKAAFNRAPPVFKGEMEEEGRMGMVAGGGAGMNSSAPAPAEENSDKKEDSSSEQSLDFDLATADFMADIILNARNWSHPLRKGFSKQGPRVDFTETLLFQGSTEMRQSKDGDHLNLFKSFHLNDQVSTFQVTANVFSSNGTLAFSKSEIVSAKPAYSKFTLPQAFLVGDILDIPVVVTNNFEDAIRFSVEVTLFADDESKNTSTFLPDINGHSQKEIFFKLNTTDLTTQKVVGLSVKVSHTDENGKVIVDDVLMKKADLAENGYPIFKSSGGYIGVNTASVESEISKTLILPNDVHGLPKVNAKIYSNPLDSLIDAVAALIRDPYGCFEQTSSTTYPMVMALRLLNEMETKISDPKEKQRVADMKKQMLEKLQKGYERLMTFETNSLGFEWFGTAPGHETLTAYGLGQFLQMKEVGIEVDDDMLTRTEGWLKDRSVDGVFQLNPRQLDSFGGSTDEISNAYIMWVLTQMEGATYHSLQANFVHLEKLLAKPSNSEDPYFIGLYAGSLFNVGKVPEAKAIVSRISTFQDSKTGAVSDARTSITSSRGKNLIVETTSIALVNWLSMDPQEYSENIELGMKYLVEHVENGGRYGATQATILALTAIVKYAETYTPVIGTGEFVAYVNGVEAQRVSFSPETANDLSSIDFSAALNAQYVQKPTFDQIEVKLSIENFNAASEGDGFKMNFIIEANYTSRLPNSAENAPIVFTRTQTPWNQVTKVGDVQKVSVGIINRSNEPQGMTIARLGVPVCMGLDMNQLETLKERGAFDNFEISVDKTEVVLYWTYLPKDRSESVSLNLVKEISDSAGSVCQQKASAGYLFYQDDLKVWVP